MAILTMPYAHLNDPLGYNPADNYETMLDASNICFLAYAAKKMKSIGKERR